MEMSILMQEFGIARMTAHKVMKALRAEGIIYTVRGLGSFVSPREGDGAAGDDPDPAGSMAGTE
ncbi:hypothetical protein ACQP1K_03130 [Sphaerimonospora sp. CA-214678]|uniref:hypothetical protein n=1 Tax=Sphaerimonospora sp. CA-214678 TaxID=3240029 RepID=UPI003D8E0DBD